MQPTQEKKGTKTINFKQKLVGYDFLSTNFTIMSSNMKNINIFKVIVIFIKEVYVVKFFYLYFLI